MYQAELDFAVSLAREAGEIARSHFQSNIAFETKSDNSPVTAADTGINSLAIERVKQSYPGVGVLAEEESFEGTDANKLWVCDPIDGTIPYTLGIPASTFCLAYVVDGVPEVGVVYDFNNDKLYSAIRGGQVQLNGSPFVPASQSAMELVNLEWYHAATYNLAGVREKLFESNHQVTNYASGGYISMRVASGIIKANIYAGDKAWDVAAVKVVVEAAGGVVTDLDGNEQRYDGPLKGAIATKPHFLPELLDIIREYKRGG